MKYFLLLFNLLCLIGFNNAQETKYARIKGKVITEDYEKKGIEVVQILINGKFYGDYTEDDGSFNCRVPANENITLTFSYLGKQKQVNISALSASETRAILVPFPLTAIELETANVSGKARRKIGGITLDPKRAYQLPSPGAGGIEAIIKTMPGVSSGNEMSSQYNVRGGSFDENLVYVNDFEIIRPQLIRTGQQEGLSFINPFMVKNVFFSAGGFEAKYGDKLSSVLDVSYRTPKRFEATGEVSFLGAELSLGGNSKNFRLNYIAGLRYRANNYVLNSLDVQGEYNPRFLDFQSLVVYNFTKDFRLEWLTNIAQNQFQLTPISQTTSFGTVQAALQLFVGMAGNEVMEYNTAMSGLSFVYQPNKSLELKLMASGVSSQESERYDIFGAYRLDVLDNNLGSTNFGNPVASLGNGFFINHARNALFYQVVNLEHKGNYTAATKPISLQWGTSFRSDFIQDRFKEWRYNDSSEYNINTFNLSDDQINLSEYINSGIDIRNNRIQSYMQGSWEIDKESKTELQLGVRSHYSSLNNQHVFSPRFQFSFEPNAAFNDKQLSDSTKKKDLAIRIAGGYYYQPPFYREMRDFDGNINTDLRAQRSVHLIAGTDYYFQMWNRPFKLFSEVYYKQLDNLVPYVLDNMRIRYYANNGSRGYATGFDTRIHGEFVKNLESWFTLSVMRTSEKITYLDGNSEEVESPFIRRPTDRRVSASLMFQDEMPNFPNFRVNLNMVFGAPLPYFLPGPARYRDGYRIPAYRRVDAGFNYMLVKENEPKSTKFSKVFREAWVGVEVFNMLAINNVISFLWVKDLQNNVFGVPNFLTARRVSLRFVGSF